MKKAMILASAAMISIALLSGGAGGQGTPQTVELVKVDVHKLAAGYRASRSLAAASSMMPTRPSGKSTIS
jgi:hypothetical protein